jgi:hypothetical protein
MEYRIYIIKTPTGVTLEEADTIFRKNNEKLWNAYLKRKEHEIQVLKNNELQRRLR